MATLFSSGWEDSGGSDATDGGAWASTYGDPVVVASPTHHGGYALQTIDTHASVTIKTGLNKATLFTRVYFRLPSTLSVGENIAPIRYRNSDWGSIAQIYIDNYEGTHYVGIEQTSGWVESVEIAALEANRWYCLELKVTVGSSTGVLQVWLDDVSIKERTGQNLGTNNIDVVSVGANTENEVDFYLDCVVMADEKIGVESFYPYIQQVSNVDSVADVGTHSDFTKQQTAPDSTYDTLTEADTDTGTSQLGDTSGSGTSYRTVAANEFRGVAIQAANTGQIDSIVFYGRGSSTVNVKGIVTNSSGNLLTNGVGNAVSVSTTAGSKTLTFTNKPLITAGTTYWIGLIPEGNLRLYYDATTGGAMKQDTTNSYSTPQNTGAVSDTTETWRILYANVTELNYQLQLEEQFTAVPYDAVAGFTLHIQTGAYSSPSETLNVQVWDAANSEWDALGALTASTDNSYDVSNYATSANLYIRFISGTETNDNIQSTWQIDSVWLAAKYLKTFTVNATLEAGAATYTKTFSAAANLTGTRTKTFTVGGGLLKNLPKTFTAGGNLLKNTPKTFTAGGNLKNTLTKTFTTGGSLKANLTKPFTANGSLLQSENKTFTAGSNLKSNYTKPFTVNGGLQGNVTKPFTVGANLLQQFTETFTAGGNLTNTGTAVFTVDGDLLKQDLKEVNYNAELEKTQTIAFTFSGSLQQTLTAESTVNALLIVTNTASKPFSFNSQLLKELPLAFTLDADLIELLYATAEQVLDGYWFFTKDGTPTEGTYVPRLSSGGGRLPENPKIKEIVAVQSELIINLLEQKRKLNKK